jgi:hypothetical protein
VAGPVSLRSGALKWEGRGVRPLLPLTLTMTTSTQQTGDSGSASSTRSDDGIRQENNPLPDSAKASIPGLSYMVQIGNDNDQLSAEITKRTIALMEQLKPHLGDAEADNLKKQLGELSMPIFFQSPHNLTHHPTE